MTQHIEWMEPGTHEVVYYGTRAETWDVDAGPDGKLRTEVFNATENREAHSKGHVRFVAARREVFRMGNGDDVGKRLQYRNVESVTRTITVIAPEWAVDDSE